MMCIFCASFRMGFDAFTKYKSKWEEREVSGRGLNYLNRVSLIVITNNNFFPSWSSFFQRTHHSQCEIEIFELPRIFLSAERWWYSISPWDLPSFSPNFYRVVNPKCLICFYFSFVNKFKIHLIHLSHSTLLVKESNKLNSLIYSVKLLFHAYLLGLIRVQSYSAQGKSTLF